MTFNTPPISSIVPANTHQPVTRAVLSLSTDVRCAIACSFVRSTSEPDQSSVAAARNHLKRMNRARPLDPQRGAARRVARRVDATDDRRLLAPELERQLHRD